MDFTEFSAKSVEEAITKACLELQVTSDQLDYDVITEGSNGFFGFGRKDAVSKARKKGKEKPAFEKSKPKKNDKDTKDNKDSKNNSSKGRIKTLDEIDAKAKASSGNSTRSEKKDKAPKEKEEEPRRSKPKPEKAVPERTDEEIARMIEDAKTFLTGVFEKMGLEVEQDFSYDKTTGYLTGVFSGPEMGIIIGKRGQTLDSLQYLTSLVVNKNQNEYVRLKLDTEEYRRRRKETLESLSRNIAAKVKRNKRPVALEPMNPYERRIIHSALQGNKAVYTYSEGEEPYRRVIVAYNKKNK